MQIALNEGKSEAWGFDLKRRKKNPLRGQRKKANGKERKYLGSEDF